MAFFCDLLKSIHRAMGCCTPSVQFRIGLIRDSDGSVTKTPQFRRRLQCGGYFVSTAMKTEQEFDLAVEYLNDKGKPAKVDGIPTWATDNSDLVALTPSADGMSCNVKSLTFDGTANVQVSADADLGQGTVLILGTEEVVISQRPATTVVLKPGPVTDTP